MSAPSSRHFLTSTSIGTRFSSKQTSGFDYLRVGLALAVLIWHNFNLTLGMGPLQGFQNTIPAVLVRLVLPLFFALSGFLVASSLERVPTLKVFLWHRAVRLFPALTVEITLSALILGPLLTVYALEDYVQDPRFLLYFANIFGWIHYELPGLFLGNPNPAVVNGSLWTIPYELECYIALSALFLLGMATRLKWMIPIFVGLTALAAARYGFEPWTPAVAVPGRTLVLDFLAGVIVYLLRNRLPGGVVPGLISLSLSGLLLYWPFTASFSPLLVAHAVAALGCTTAPKPRILSSGDYSYGIYLYAYPIQQSVVLAIGGNKPWETLVLSLLCVIAFAVFSWHCVEKPLLRYKSLFNPKKSFSAAATIPT